MTCTPPSRWRRFSFTLALILTTFRCSERFFIATPAENQEVTTRNVVNRITDVMTSQETRPKKKKKEVWYKNPSFKMLITLILEKLIKILFLKKSVQLLVL